MESTSLRNDLIKVTKLYYHGNCTQDEIAKIMGCSRPRVSRMLTMARELKIVEFKISESVIEIERMEDDLKEKLGLKDIIILPSESGRLGTMYAAGSKAGEYLNKILRPDMKIGISWGATIDTAVSQFKPDKQFNSIIVVQMIGGSPTSSFNIDSRELTIRLANKLGASYSILQAPQYVSSKKVRDLLMEEPEIKAHFKLLQKLDLAIIGISSRNPEDSAAYRAGYLSLEDTRILQETGFITDVSGTRIYKDGSIRKNEMNDKLIAIDPEDLKKIPTIIAVAVGDEKAETILTAAKGGFFNVLITDEVAAITMLGRLDNM
jgi:DNA-binding transcriptional regulator LsrR (DeoR family)